ncbi:GGDEF domain-containing protein [Vulcaniibacterium thermophilum]|uniref:diguanylate cyclase n=2 Tax=Vulcaniibacterium thermophilum TaxID=1169913 RepID=A0A919DH36_9GAMM|nr:hypothetical protein GCM10007167_24640 [Vulcaniibacterium thermophilum]
MLGTFPRLMRAALALLLLHAAGMAAAAGATVQVDRLDEPSATAAEVVAGLHDARFVPAEKPAVIQQRGPSAVWWRVRSTVPRPAASEPHLLLLSPRHTVVEAWVPGRATPTRHALYGRDSDPRHSTRALVVPLPDGLQPGQPIYLRVTMPSPVPVKIAIETRAQVQEGDLRHAAWRAAILAATLVLVVLALTYWIGVGDRSFVYLALLLLFVVLFSAGMGGELRAVPGLGRLFGSGPQPARVAAAAGLVASCLFFRRYLDLQQYAPRHDRLFAWLTWIAVGLTLANLVSPSALNVPVFNAVLPVVALAVLSASLTSLWAGNRAARYLTVGWLPVLVTISLRAAQPFGLLQDWTGIDQMISVSYAFGGVLLTIGLSDKLLELRRDRDEASRRATFDALTGAYTRHAIDGRLAQEVADAEANGRPLCVAFVDIDHFKRINDTHGHNVGDQCLRYVSLRIRNVLRGSDVLARYGGDELLVLMPDTTLSEAGRIAERMREAVACRPLALDDLRLPSTLSIGVAEYVPGEGVERLLERADGALYRSKSAGRNRVSAQESLEATGEAT